MSLEEYGFTPEQIDAQKSVLHMTDESEPGGPASRIWPIFLGEDAPHDILINVDLKGPRDFLRDSWRAEPGIAAFRFQNELDKLKGGPFGPRLSSSL